VSAKDRPEREHRSAEREGTSKSAGPQAAHRRAQVMMVGAALCWSSGGFFVRQLSINDPWQILFWRALFVVLFLCGLLFAIHGRAMPRAVLAVGRPGLLSGSFSALASVCFLGSLAYTTVTNTYVLMSVSPFVAAIGARILLREHVPRITWIAMSVAAAGIYVLFSGSLGTRSMLGDLLALGVCCAFTGQIITLRKVGVAIDMLPQVMIAGLIAVGIGFVMAPQFAVNGRDLAILATMGCVQIGIGSSLSTRASRHLPAAEMGLIGLLEPILGPLWVWVFLAERPGASALQGAAIVLLAVAANQVWRYHSLTRAEAALTIKRAGQ